ncbi:hypothetical protein EMIHUDRAFT_218749 [Emiliania huxleyi CCMP1516]|uniref:Uncharacterized protein n=2 Tax=Emiliania huxleyi TaxID=2903 RepID=A0A0D3HYV9_EMIH1|nr:hypothetical protein EMIHUDRAFT_221269 [Emiliania huxleyi CCMP1516]XP_005759427.1 hypothetical protein EMIHUDRAFT_218749 [Emiliania huxleyi CCMP1516]EOD04194.1 hypothetical protein EMIHUDRAFT_221269 [Emiliania huxleyi CCMP1516]EOD06998.1 hypothetical protein EMIHUDRAFT_218749 [Emiliania huxleyi CCMP1516]|eukprot:XP_005756623.1 hypothetical protein EMIHUDRAFT_221269 [Emiliania huxleyi CCMP1516]
MRALVTPEGISPILTSAGRKTAWGHYGSYELFSGLSAEPRGVMACGARPPCDWCPSFGAAIFGGLIFDEGSDLSEAALPWREGRRCTFHAAASGALTSDDLAKKKNDASVRGGGDDRVCDDGEDHGAAWGVVLSRMCHAVDAERVSGCRPHDGGARELLRVVLGEATGAAGGGAVDGARAHMKTNVKGKLLAN